jgi:histone acetyltransferase (RNA polymerase elongator complex component)
MRAGSQARGGRGCFIVPVFLPHAGCPHRCVFCDQQMLARSDHDRSPGADWKSAAVDFLRFRGSRRSAAEIAFYGGTFLGLPARRIRELLGDAAEIVKAEGLDGIRFSTRPDSVSDRTLDLISDFPVVTVELGAQSMSDAVLRESGRGHTAEDTRDAVARLKLRGYRVGLQVMVGLPAESLDRVAETARGVAALAPDFARIYPTLVLAGSELERMFLSGGYRPLTLAEAVSLAGGLYRFFRAGRIAVVRTGLQPTRDLTPGAAVTAGPHHPAFGHLVQSACFREALLDELSQASVEPGALRAHPRSISCLRGHRNETLSVLKAEYGWSCPVVEPDPGLPEDAIALPGGRIVWVYDRPGSDFRPVGVPPGRPFGLTGLS